jgi:TfoX/Sxy family transcriptional regulator of competence genes
MATDKDFADYILEQLSGAGEVTAKKMFGEYGIFLNGKMAAIIADNQLFVKPTEAGRKFIGEPEEAPPYTGAKNYFLIDNLDDPEWLSELVKITEKELPLPKPKKKKAGSKE